MKLITRDTDYAVNALYYMAEDKKRIFTVTELVKKLGIPRAFLRRILQVLSKRGLVRSFKGNGGGFKLSISPEKIFLSDIMEIFQGRFKINECLLNRKACPNIKTCRLKKKIDLIERYIYSELKSVTLDSLLK